MNNAQALPLPALWVNPRLKRVFSVGMVLVPAPGQAHSH